MAARVLDSTRGRSGDLRNNIDSEDTRRRGRVAERRPSGAADCADEEIGEPIEIVDELHFDNVVDEGPGAPAPPDLFAALGERLEAALRCVAGAEASTHASVVRRLLGLEPWDRSIPEDRAAACLEVGDIAKRDGDALIPTTRFTRQVQAWRGVLRGEVDDFGSCGAATLDEWTADLLSRVLGDTGRAPTIRRELRARGVAAFGIVPRH